MVKPNHDSPEQVKQSRDNKGRMGKDQVPGIDKRLNGPNRPAE